MNKRAITLLEIMIVIFLISLITGVIGYNLKGSMDKGRAFKSRQGKEQLRNLLLLCLEDPDSKDKNITMENLKKDPEKYIDALGLAKDPQTLLKDGWGESYKIEIKGGRDFDVISEKLLQYETRTKPKK